MKKLWLPSILILAFLLRFINLTSFPVGFNADETSFGYDAYSILKTGKDQWGNYLPLTLKSFGDYKSPLYSYMAIPFVAVFGLTPFAVRLPNVLVGTLSVYVVYLLTMEINKKLKNDKSMKNEKWKMENLTALLLAISPWSIMLSRGAFEANLITLFIPLGIYLFLKEKYNWSAIIFGLSLFTYHSAKILSPVIFLTLLIIFKKKNYISILVYSIFIIATVWTLVSGAGARISERSITRGALEEGAKIKIALIQNGTNPILAKALHNKYQVISMRFINNYKQYFSVKFLLSQGAGEYYYGMIHGVGVIYIFEGIFLLGLLKILFDKKYKKVLLLLFSWLLLAPIPAALSTGVGYSGHRAVGMIPVLQILIAFGVLGWVQIFKSYKNINMKVLVVVIGFLVGMNVNRFMSIYFKNIPKESYNQMLYGNLEFSRWINENKSNNEVIISRSLSEPQIFLAFAQKMDPFYYQKDSKRWQVETWVDQIPQYQLGGYTIKSIDWKLDTKLKNVILVARPDEFPKGIIPDKTFSLPDGSPNIYVKEF